MEDNRKKLKSLLSKKKSRHLDLGDAIEPEAVRLIEREFDKNESNRPGSTRRVARTVPMPPHIQEQRAKLRALTDQLYLELHKMRSMRDRMWADINDHTEAYAEDMRINEDDYDEPMIEILASRSDEEDD